MAHSRSARKALRRSLTHRQRNKSVRTRLTTETRKFEKALERGDVAGARSQLSLMTKLLQRAADKGIMHANTAARRQARLCKQLEKAAKTAK